MAASAKLLGTAPADVSEALRLPRPKRWASAGYEKGTAMQYMTTSQAIGGWSNLLSEAIQPKADCFKATSGAKIAEEALLHTILLR